MLYGSRNNTYLRQANALSVLGACMCCPTAGETNEATYTEPLFAHQNLRAVVHPFLRSEMWIVILNRGSNTSASTLTGWACAIVWVRNNPRKSFAREVATRTVVSRNSLQTSNSGCGVADNHQASSWYCTVRSFVVSTWQQTRAPATHSHNAWRVCNICSRMKGQAMWRILRLRHLTYLRSWKSRHCYICPFSWSMPSPADPARNIW